LQSVPALLQALGQVAVVVTHAALALHIAAEVLTPPVHDCAAPHSVPVGLLMVVAQTDVPVVHDVLPYLHGLLGVQVRPAVQETQLPVLQTMFMPQVAPSASEVPASVQTALPVEQDSVPLWQGLVGTHDPPAAQATQPPLLQTMFGPQLVPFGRFPVSAQTDAPVTHEVAPVRQRLVGWQLAAEVQVLQLPLLQTLLVPHTVPLTSMLPLSAQDIGEQAVNPAWQGLVGMQARPAVQATQAPPLQTMFVPQLVPSATLPDSTQLGVPVLQVVMPVRQGLADTVQLALTVQAPQAPVALQTLFVPQDVPAATRVPLSVHCGVPVAQASVPT
jgi:hypothetical protein